MLGGGGGEGGKGGNKYWNEIKDRSRENEGEVVDDDRTESEKESRKKNASTHPNCQKYLGLVCTGQRAERKNKRTKRELEKRKTFSVRSKQSCLWITPLMRWTRKPKGGFRVCQTLIL